MLLPGDHRHLFAFTRLQIAAANLFTRQLDKNKPWLRSRSTVGLDRCAQPSALLLKVKQKSLTSLPPQDPGIKSWQQLLPDLLATQLFLFEMLLIELGQSLFQPAAIHCQQKPARFLP